MRPRVLESTASPSAVVVQVPAGEVLSPSETPAARKLNNGPILTQKRLVYLELSTVSDFTITYVPVAMYNYARCLVQTVQVPDKCNVYIL